jgi:hypothetical protein
VIDALTAKVPNVIPTSLQHGVLKITQSRLTDDQLIAQEFNNRVRKNWLRYSLCYSILSIAAKTILELGFFFLVLNWKPWEDDVESAAVVSK